MRLRSTSAILTSAITIGLAGCPALAAPSSTGTPALGSWGFDLSAMDRAIRPGDDFFLFANGGWITRTPIPPDKSNYGLFNALQDRAQEQVRTIIEDSERASAAPAGDLGKIGAFYRAFMDEAHLEALDAKPLAARLDRIRAADDKAGIARLMGMAQGSFGAGIFALSVGPDDRDPTRYVLSAHQSGLTLRSRDYYLTQSFAEKKREFSLYVAKALSMVDWPDAEKAAVKVVAFETRVAEASWSITESQQLENLYHPTTPTELATRAPGFDWNAWLAGAGVSHARQIIVRQDTAFPKIAQVFASTDLDTLKAWEAFRTIDMAAPYLSKRFVEARFDFRGRKLLGQAEDRPRWRRGVDLVNDSLGEVVGQAYVARYFSPASKATMEGLVGELKIALRRRMEAVRWMTPPTKARALAKLSTLGQKLGYPDKWRDYSGLTITPDDLVGDVERSNAFEWSYQRSRVDRPVDHLAWEETPQTVNGFYDEKQNEIVVPAAILQPPFFDPQADMAVNFGAIGAVIGHEMTHGFDSQGRKTDERGRLADWWRPKDAARFEAQAARLGAQYDAYYVAPGAHVNGSQTMSENIADLGGLLLALDAYHASLRGRPAPLLDGMTGDQRVFLGWTQILRAKIRPEALLNQLATDPHAPDHFRAIGPVRNIDAWYTTWNVKPGDTNYILPKARVRIW